MFFANTMQIQPKSNLLFKSTEITHGQPIKFSIFSLSSAQYFNASILKYAAALFTQTFKCLVKNFALSEFDLNDLRHCIRRYEVFKLTPKFGFAFFKIRKSLSSTSADSSGFPIRSKSSGSIEYMRENYVFIVLFFAK